MPSADSGEALGNDGTVQNWRATEVGKYIICQFQVTRDWRGVLINCRVRAARQCVVDNTKGTVRRVP